MTTAGTADSLEMGKEQFERKAFGERSTLCFVCELHAPHTTVKFGHDVHSCIYYLRNLFSHQARDVVQGHFKGESLG